MITFRAWPKSLWYVQACIDEDGKWDHMTVMHLDDPESRVWGLPEMRGAYRDVFPVATEEDSADLRDAIQQMCKEYALDIGSPEPVVETIVKVEQVISPDELDLPDL